MANQHPFDILSAADGEALHKRYVDLLDELFDGERAPVELPWQDGRFRKMFLERVRNINQRLQHGIDAAKKWGAITELASHIGTAK